jgi:ribosomal protein S18 acetylase RimI-like enzyme
VNPKVGIREGKPTDIDQVYELIKELAVFEKAANEVDISPENLREDAFGENAIAEIFVAERDGNIVGAAIIYEKYSTWKGRSMHLEDLIVKEEHRGVGIGKEFFEFLIRLAAERNYGRMEWQVLDWNEPAIEFYKKYESQFLEEWLDCRLDRNDLMRLSK